VTNYVCDEGQECERAELAVSQVRTKYPMREDVTVTHRAATPITNPEM